MDLSQFKLPTKDVVKPQPKYTMLNSIAKKSTYLQFNIDCKNFFTERGIDRVELLINDDATYVALAKSEVGGTSLRRVNGITMGYSFVSDRIRALYPNEDKKRFEGFAEGDVLYFKLV